MNPSIKSGRARPVVAIVGRPNVGKSSIFNRLAGRRIAIVHEEPGITRDRIMSTIRIGASVLDLVDTGGIADAEAGGESRAMKNSPMEAAVRRQVDLALAEADAVIFAADARQGVTAADEKAAALLRKTGLPVLLAANKIDSPELEAHARDFDRFGFPVFAVSAVNSLGFMELAAELAKSIPPGCPEEMPRLRVAIVGRPNVGKSLLVNRLTLSERVIVSGEPGTTRDSVDVPLEKAPGATGAGYILTDTAGLRRTKSIKFAADNFSQMRSRASIKAADVVALVIDAQEGPTAHDKNIAAFILENHKPCLIVINKWDLVRRSKPDEFRAALYEALPFMDFVPVICASAATGFNTGQIIDCVNYVAGQSRERVATGILNRALAAAVDRFQPPCVRGSPLKIYYATQIASHPITFLLFVNDPAKMTAGYGRYLVSAIRKNFGFEGVPIVLTCKKRNHPDRPGAP